ncbi:MAG: DnaB-like helicase C-terminal domain-containing protein [Verrucomicrobiota bacterium]|nr:DnaB-like helicase C-terminal domain-containing protein [Verrucomicrobiota bacterium]
MERIAEKEPVNEAAVVTAAKMDEAFLENNGSVTDILDMTNEAPVAGNWKVWMPELQSKLRRRQYINYAQDLMRLAGDCDNIDLLADDAESRLMQLRSCRKTKTEGDRTASFGRIIEMLEKAHQGDGLIGLPSGYQDLDKILCGLRGGQLITIASRPGMGKSALACNIAIQLGYMREIPVGAFSLEMSMDELNARMLASISEVNLQAFVSKEYGTERRKKAMADLAANMPKLVKAPIYIEPRTDITINQIRAEARRMVRNHNVGILFVDYLQLVGGSGNRNGNRVTEVGQISRGLKSMAMELDVPVVALAQLNRQVENDGNRAPRLADLRESGAIEADSDVVMFIWVESYDFAEGGRLLTRIEVAKNRAGRSGNFHLCFNRDYSRFEDWRDHQDLIEKYEQAAEQAKNKKKFGRKTKL